MFLKSESSIEPLSHRNSSPITERRANFSSLFPSEYCEIFKNTFFIEHLRWLLLMIIKLVIYDFSRSFEK